MESYFRKQSGHFSVEDVYCKFHITDTHKPIVVSFAGAGDFIKTQRTKLGVSPWGFEFIKKNGGNVISFAAIDVSNWYRNAKFESFLEHVTAYIADFPSRLGYGGSMGGYGVSAFSNKLRLDRVLLINPISTLNKIQVPWERRFSSAAARYDWGSGCFDGRHVTATGYVVYDPLHKFDKWHARRYGENIKHLRVYGVGHSMARHLQSMGMLGKLYRDFVNDSIDEHDFYVNARARRYIDQYYKRQLASFNRRLTPARKEILDKHHTAIKRKRLLESLGIFDVNISPLAELTMQATISQEDRGLSGACNDALLRIGSLNKDLNFETSWERGLEFIKNGGFKYYKKVHLVKVLNAEKIVLSGTFDAKRPSNGFILGFLSSLHQNLGTVLVSKGFNLKNIDGLPADQLKRINDLRLSIRQ